LKPTTGQQSIREVDGINVVVASGGEILDFTGKTASVDAMFVAGSNGSSSSNVEVLGSITPLLSVSSDSGIPCLSEDNPFSTMYQSMIRWQRRKPTMRRTWICPSSEEKQEELGSYPKILDRLVNKGALDRDDTYS
jgi:hypothetical protein